MTSKQQSDAPQTDPGESGATAERASPVQSLFSVLSFMTRLPIPTSHHVAPGNAVWAFPIAGLVVGAIGGLTLWGSREVGLGVWVSGLLAVAATAILTGALHEDGLADSCDGLWGGATTEKRLQIMRDSRIGGFGALALIIATGLKVALLAEISSSLEAAAALVVAHVLGRTVPAFVMFSLDPASEKGLASSAGRPSGIAIAGALVLGGGATILLTGAAGAAAIGAALLVTVGAHALFKAKIGGYNGDTLGASEQAGEIGCLMAIVVLVGKGTYAGAL